MLTQEQKETMIAALRSKGSDGKENITEGIQKNLDLFEREEVKVTTSRDRFDAYLYSEKPYQKTVGNINVHGGGCTPAC